MLQTTCREQPAHEILDADMRAAIVVFGIGCGLDPLVLRAGDSVLPKNRLLTRGAPHGPTTVREWWLAKVQDQGPPHSTFKLKGSPFYLSSSAGVRAAARPAFVFQHVHEHAQKHMGYIVKRFQPGDGSTSRHARVHFARRLLKASAGAVDYQRLDLRILQRNAAPVDPQCAPVDAHEARSWVVNPLPRMGRSTARKDRMPGVRAKLDDKPAPPTKRDGNASIRTNRG